MSDEVYAVAQVNVNDHAEYIAEYAMATGALIAEFGGEVLAATPAAQAVEGEWAGNWTVIFRFPSAKKLAAFYNSSAYAPLKDARINRLASFSNIATMPAFDPSSL